MLRLNLSTQDLKCKFEECSNLVESASLVHILDVVDVALVELVGGDELSLGLPLVLIFDLLEFLSPFD